MSEHGGFLWIMDEARRAWTVEEYIERDKTFTDTVSSDDWPTKDAEVFLLSLDNDKIHFACLARRGNKVATKKSLVRFSNFLKFEPSIEIQQVESLLKASFRQHFSKSSSGEGKRITTKTWIEVINAIKLLRPMSVEGLERLHELRQVTRKLLDKPGAHIFLQERDAVNLSLRMADFDPVEITEWTPSEGDLAPFLAGLQSAVLIEDQMVAHDAEVFGDWQRLRRYLVGSTVFSKGQERLTVMNVNRHAVEKTSGVDLVYYFYSHQSYILIQYKRMMKENEGLMYRLNDDSYTEELARMNELERIFNASQQLPLAFDPKLTSYRLHTGTFYFKLCAATITDITSPEMMPGMYIPLDYWKMIVESDDIIGPKGGRRVTYENVGRYFNNTFFVDLARNGWVGSMIKNKSIITSFISQAIEKNRSVVLSTLRSIP